MQLNRRAVIVAAWLVAVAAGAVYGQATIDPSGHWQGSLQTPAQSISFDIDLARDATGGYVGTISVAAQKIKGLPLTRVAIDGDGIAFQARSDQPFTGVLSEDRRTITGEFLISGNSLPFTLTRTGEAQIDAPRKSPAITNQLAGTWTATLTVEGVAHHIVMTLENLPDGSGSGRIVNEDQGGLELPIAIAQQGSTVTIETLAVASTLTATLNADATELDGTIVQGPATVPVTFRRTK